MNPPGKTTLSRMQLAALNEQERIEISQDWRVREGMLKAPMPAQVSLRDDYAGIVRLIDLIMADAVVLQRIQEKLARSSPSPALAGRAGVGGGAADDGDELVALAQEATPSMLRDEGAPFDPPPRPAPSVPFRKS